MLDAGTGTREGVFAIRTDTGRTHLPEARISASGEGMLAQGSPAFHPVLHCSFLRSCTTSTIPAPKCVFLPQRMPPPLLSPPPSPHSILSPIVSPLLNPPTPSKHLVPSPSPFTLLLHAPLTLTISPLPPPSPSFFLPLSLSPSSQTPSSFPHHCGQSSMSCLCLSTVTMGSTEKPHIVWGSLSPPRALQRCEPEQLCRKVREHEWPA